MSGTMLVEFTEAEHEKFVAWYQSITGGKQCNIIPPKFSPLFDEAFSRRRGLCVELDDEIWRETEGTKVVSFDYNIGDGNSAVFAGFIADHLWNNNSRFKPNRIGWDSTGWTEPDETTDDISHDTAGRIQRIISFALPHSVTIVNNEFVFSEENKQQQALFRQELQAGVNRLFDETSDKSEFLLNL